MRALIYILLLSLLFSCEVDKHTKYLNNTFTLYYTGKYNQPIVGYDNELNPDSIYIYNLQNSKSINFYSYKSTFYFDGNNNTLIASSDYIDISNSGYYYSNYCYASDTFIIYLNKNDQDTCIITFDMNTIPGTALIEYINYIQNSREEIFSSVLNIYAKVVKKEYH